MLRIRADQHAKILGVAVFGYGLQFIWDAVREFFFIWHRLAEPFSQASFADLVFASFADKYPIYIYCVVSLLAGLAFFSARSRSVIPGVLFALCFVTYFPLGTILSFYVLVYLFAIRENAADAIDA
jgi:hypothetical protein